MNKYLKEFEIANVGCFKTWKWNHNVAGIGLSEDELIDAIRSKISTDYTSSNTDEVWLLIHTGPNLSQSVGPPIEDWFLDKLNEFKKCDELLNSSCFDKVFFYEYWRDNIFEWPGWKSITKSKLQSEVSS